MLEINGLTKTFGGVKEVHNVSLRILAGEIRGVIGPNGAGKSTLVNLISGLLTQSAGSLALDHRIESPSVNALGIKMR